MDTIARPASNVGHFSVIDTKLSPSTRSVPWLNRPRLAIKLTAPEASHATLLCAPAGYGKTVAMSQAYQLLKNQGDKVGWASFDRYDTSLVHFMLYLMAAMRRALPGFGAKFFRLFDETEPVDTNIYIDTALSEIATVREQVWIFLDDLQYVDTPLLPNLVESIIRYSPDCVRYVFATRDNEQLALWQLCAEQKLQIVDTNALAFSSVEAKDYFRSSNISDLDEAGIDVLNRATEGWGMGLQLARLAMKLNGEARDITEALSGKNKSVRGYLLDNVFSAQPPELQSFLLRTSILGRMCAANCEAVTGDVSSQAMLRKLEQANLFIVALDAEGTWFRYHHLFQDFLQQQLQHSLSVAEIAQLRKTASLWFREQQLPEEALELASASHDLNFTAQTLDAICGTLTYTGNHSAFRAAIDSISPDILGQYPRLALDQAWIELMNWNFTTARSLIENVSSSFSESSDAVIKNQDRLLHRKLMLQFHSGNFKEATALGEQWIATYPRAENYVTGSVLAVMLMSRAYMLDNMGAAIIAKKTEKLFMNENRRNGLVWHLCMVGLTHEARGALNPAFDAYNEALALSKELEGAPSGVLEMPAIFISQIYYERNELDKAQWLIDAHSITESPGGLVDSILAQTLTSSKLLCVANRPLEALQVLQEGTELAAAYDIPRIAQIIEGERMRQELAIGRLTEARASALRAGVDLTRAVDPGSDKSIWDAAKVISWARLMLATGSHRDVLPVLRRWMDYCADRDAQRLSITFAILLARAKVLDGDDGGALRLLSPAIKKGAELGLIRTFVDEGTVVHRLLVKLYEGDSGLTAEQKVYVRELLRVYGKHDEPKPTETVQQELTALSPRELEILTLISQGIKSSFIGARLGITEGTVKWHLQHIFQKLGVRTRREAIERAKGLGLFEVVA